MLKLAKKIKKGKPADCTFDRTFENQKMGIEMLMCCNMNNRDYITGPEVGINQNVVVHKDKPHFLFNPTVTTKVQTKTLRYNDYMGNELKLTEWPEYLNEALEKLNAD